MITCRYESTGGGARLVLTAADAEAHAAAIALLKGSTLRLVANGADRTASVDSVRYLDDGGVEFLLGGGLGANVSTVQIIGTLREPWWATS